MEPQQVQAELSCLKAESLKPGKVEINLRELSSEYRIILQNCT